MAEILKQWLTERLQRPVRWEAEEFGQMMKDGHIVAGVLHSYHVINDEKYYLIRSSNAAQEILSNWKYISEWLHDIDVYLNDSELNNVMEGRGSTLLRLFYQLFLHLDKRDRTNFIKREREMVSNLVEKMGNRFKVDKITEEEEPFFDHLSKPLLNEKQFIEWKRSKSEQIKETYDFVRYKYSKMLEKIEESKAPLQQTSEKYKKLQPKEKIDIEKFAVRFPCKYESYTYENLIELDEKAAQRKKSLVDTEWAKDYMDNLHIKMHNKSDTEEFQKQIRNVLSSSLWDMSIAEEETKLDTELAKKVMKLSHFEKQMCTQIMETKQQARNVTRNRIQAEKEFAEQREHQFNQFLDNVKEQINLEVVEIDFEKQRQQTLHKRLYAEKIKRKRQHYYEVCYETMLSIVDYATKYAYFKLLIGDDIPDHFIHEWKTLYFKHQPIFDILDPMENIIKEHCLEEEMSSEEEEVNKLEFDRQNALNYNDFNEYHNYFGPWTLDLLIPNYDSEAEERKYEYLGMRILGHVIYTLLEIKYPYPPSRAPSDLPNFRVKALLRGLPDRSVAATLQTLLAFQKIHVTRPESAVNFCLHKFKIEMVGCTDIDLSYDKFIAVAQEDDKKDLIKLMKIEDEAINKSYSTNQQVGLTPPNTKQTQTPKTIPEEEIRLSTAADIGRYAYETLSFGESLTDHLLAAMFVEYIKDQVDINGFVIVNYPNSYREAQILEEIFSGRCPPDEGDLDDRDDIFLEESISKHRRKIKDPLKYVRVSRIVSDPHKKRIETPFESYFTCYMKLKETENILQEDVIWDLTEDNSELIDRFYAALGINYSMFYEVIEKDILAMIGKYIIGDLNLPFKSNNELFGDNILSTLDFPSSEDRRQKSKVVKPEVSSMIGKSKEKLRRGSKSKSTLMDTVLETAKPVEDLLNVSDEPITLLEVVAEEDNESKTSLNIEAIKLIAGEEDWDYGEIPISEPIGIALATYWEQAEKNYVDDMEQLFFSRRLIMNSLVPYARFIKEKIEQIITLPSKKQDLVLTFQKDYNEFENDWRDINLAKNEWHCRVKELQKCLYNICDQRKLFSEQQRQALICENWTMEELTSLVNTYVSCMQIELNRFFITYQIMHDFYFAMMKRLPPTDRLSSKDLVKINREADDTSGSKKGGEDKVFRQLKTAFIDLQLKNISIDYSNNPFNMIIENNVKLALKAIKDTNDSYRSLISKEYSEIAKVVIPTKKKDDLDSSESICPEEVLKLNMLKCIEEWTMGVNGEMFRASLRLLALQYKCYRDMKLFNDHIYKTFTNVQNDINSYYLNEIRSVDHLCKYFQITIEGGRKISETLILEHDTFVIDPNLLQFAPTEPPPDTGEAVEIITDIDFRISQLARLRSQFKICAPTGICLQQSFIYLLQDFIIYGKECCDGPLFPEAWKRINPEQVPKLVYSIFGDTVYIDWRDFLVYCLNLRFPTYNELLDLRNVFRCKDLDSSELITREKFLEVVLWYENDFELKDKNSELRKNLVKNFLFELFETAADTMNYSAFLLAFCKSSDPIEGFGMALSMAVGKRVCYQLEECSDIISKFIDQKRYRDGCLACAYKCTEQFLDTMINNVLKECEGTTITEIEYVEPSVDLKKGKKSKGGLNKSKTSQSARDPKPKTPLGKNKASQSATDVKTTYICRPCEDDAQELEEKAPEPTVIEEEPPRSESVQEDPNMSYSVSQSVIWNVLQICLPWHFQLASQDKDISFINQVKEVFKHLEVDTDEGDIYVCKFVTDPKVCKLLHKVNKFTALNIAEEILKVYKI